MNCSTETGQVQELIKSTESYLSFSSWLFAPTVFWWVLIFLESKCLVALPFQSTGCHCCIIPESSWSKLPVWDCEQHKPWESQFLQDAEDSFPLTCLWTPPTDHIPHETRDREINLTQSCRVCVCVACLSIHQDEFQYFNSSRMLQLYTESHAVQGWCAAGWEKKVLLKSVTVKLTFCNSDTVHVHSNISLQPHNSQSNDKAHSPEWQAPLNLHWCQNSTVISLHKSIQNWIKSKVNFHRLQRHKVRNISETNTTDLKQGSYFTSTRTHFPYIQWWEKVLGHPY